jgi:hypothetical protein
MDLETGKPADSGPQFCDPYPSQEFDKLFEKVSAESTYLGIRDLGESAYIEADGIGMSIDDCLLDLVCLDAGTRQIELLHIALDSMYLPSLKTMPMLISSNRRNKTIIEQGLDNVSGGFRRQPEWQAGRIFQPYDKSLPHRGCALYDGAISDDRLRVSEVFCIAALTAARLAVAEKTHDRFIPVGVYPNNIT